MLGFGEHGFGILVERCIDQFHHLQCLRQTDRANRCEGGRLCCLGYYWGLRSPLFPADFTVALQQRPIDGVLACCCTLDSSGIEMPMQWENFSTFHSFLTCRRLPLMYLVLVWAAMPPKLTLNSACDNRKEVRCAYRSGKRAFEINFGNYPLNTSIKGDDIKV